jgi:hypothetical protein
MATIGNSLAPYFTATTSDVFSANGTGTDFTLTRSISNLVDIEVLVNNIQQNPFNGAYSVNGNTLTFSEAPSAGANNVLVSYRQAVIGSTIPTPNTVASSSLQRDLTLGGNTTSNGTMFTQALVPTANVTYDIGTSTLRYKDIYLSGSTINLGDVSLSASGNTFTVANSTGGTLPSSMGNTTIAGTANVTGDMTIGGNLTVTGTMTYINTTDLNIGDAIISLNADLAANIAPTEDAGISINRGASTNAQFKWIESTDNWSLGNTTVSGILTSNDHVITGTANVSTGINVGANVNLSTSQINVGNSTVNTVITSASLSTNSVTITGGAANGVAYLNGSKVLTTGSALVFDGTNLGVGTTSFNAFINNSLQASFGTVVSKSNSTTTYDSVIGQLAINNPDTTANNFSQLAFTTSDGTNRVVSAGIFAQTTARTPSAWTTTNLQFFTGTAGNPPTLKMLLDGSGNFGVNQTSPSFKIDAIGSTTNGSGIVTTLRLKNGGTTVNDGAKILFTAGVSTDGAGIGSGGQALNSADLRFYTGGNNQAMTLDINGNLMLAVTSASRKRITVGTTTPTITATPEAIDLGATYSNAAGTNLKLLTYNDGITQHGIGVSNASSDYVTIATTGTHCFYAGTVRSVTMDVYGTISGTTSTNRTAAGGTNFPNWLSSTNLGINRNTYFEGNASTGGSNWYGAGTTPYYALDWDSTDQSRWVNNSGAWAKTHALSRNTGMENQYFNPAFVYECVTGSTTAASWNYITYNLAGGTRQLSRNSIGYDATATFTAPMAGWYFFAAQVNFSSSTDVDGTIKFIVNNNFTCYGPSSSALGGTTYPGSRQVSGALYLAGGDYVQVGVYTTAVSTIRGANAYAGSFSGFFIG